MVKNQLSLLNLLSEIGKKTERAGGPPKPSSESQKPSTPPILRRSTFTSLLRTYIPHNWPLLKSCHSRDLLFYIEAYIKQDSRLIFRLYFKSHDIIPLTRRISLLSEFIDKNLILTR
ncbi:uncharacterized protein LOC104891664 [Beta vulgaris subsp. vulgaris]|uniref:uncharacterized protein LOC104891664 n=1 Tax=Beta vulgaris subsp. vulgaris TaxID=3555 RepID=UPI0020373FEE|nr:uncharacterized protein LOC104891664 [Beta vulgaris subsp. vulgaris]